MFLSDQDVLILPVPAARPVLIRPTKAEWELDVLRFQKLFDGSFKKSAAPEPVVMKAEASNAVLASQVDLLPHDIDQTQIVKSQLSGKMGLVVPNELRYCL